MEILSESSLLYRMASQSDDSLKNVINALEAKMCQSSKPYAFQELASDCSLSLVLILRDHLPPVTFSLEICPANGDVSNSCHDSRSSFVPSSNENEHFVLEAKAKGRYSIVCSR